MFTKTTVTQSETLQAVIDALLNKLKDGNPGSEEYGEMTKQLTELHKSKQIDIDLKLKEIDALAKQQTAAVEYELKSVETNLKQEEINRLDKVKPETYAVIAANLVAVLAILWHERANVITSKALGFVGKILR